jgi:hypothetical protein
MLREGDLRMVQEGKAALERRACEEPAKLDFRKLYEAQPFLPEGMKIIFHTDGLVWELTEDLIAVRVNALHPIDPTCIPLCQHGVRQLGSRI